MDKDTINRQQAIDSVQGIGRLATLPDNDAVIRMSAVEYVLYNLPPAPERKTGKWNMYYRMHSGDTFICNRCGSCFIVVQGGDKMNFCPNCGSYNGGEQE